MGQSKRSVAAVTLAALMLASCGGGGSGGGNSSGPVTVAPTPSPTPAPTAACSLAARQAFAKAVIDEWYLFPGDIASGVNAAGHSSVQSYIDALVAPARAQGKDRFFTYITSIAEENAFFSSGASAGFGMLMTYDPSSQRVIVAEAYEGTPALAAGSTGGRRSSPSARTAAIYARSPASPPPGAPRASPMRWGRTTPASLACCGSATPAAPAR